MNRLWTCPDRATLGKGLLLFFRVDDFDQALQRARSLASRLEVEPHLNPNSRTTGVAVIKHPFDELVWNSGIRKKTMSGGRETRNP